MAIGARSFAQKGISVRLPRDSGPHRIACFALYRAVLKQCTRIRLPIDLPSRGPVNPLKHLVRKGFRRHKALTSPSLIRDAFMVGHNAEALLRTAGNGNAPAIAQIHALLQHLETKRNVSAAQPRPVRKERPRVWPYPGVPKLVDVRPLPKEKLSGRRHVPKLTETNGIAFLRIKKPQPAFLSRVLRNKLDKQEKRFEYVDSLQEDIHLGNREEEWEKLVVRKIMDEVPDAEGEGGWLDEEGGEWGLLDHAWSGPIVEIRQENWRKVLEDKARMQEHGEKLVEIYEQEKELRRLEKIESRREKTALRRSGGSGDAGASSSKTLAPSQVLTPADTINSRKEANDSDRGSSPEGKEQSSKGERLVSFKSMVPEE